MYCNINSDIPYSGKLSMWLHYCQSFEVMWGVLLITFILNVLPFIPTDTAGLILGIIGALLYVINMITILVMAIVTFRVYTRLTAWLFAVVVVVWLILPPVGLALGLWLVRKQVGEF